jgi:hypothetical protein
MSTRYVRKQDRQARLLELLENEQSGDELSKKESIELNRLAKKLKVKLPKPLRRSHLLRKAVILNTVLICLIVGGIIWATKPEIDGSPVTIDYIFNRPFISGSPKPQSPTPSPTPSASAAPVKQGGGVASSNPNATPYQAPNFDYTPPNFNTSGNDSSNNCSALRTTYTNQYQSALASENQRYSTQRSQINSAIAKLNSSGAGSSSAMNQLLAMQASNESQHNATLNQIYNTYQSQLASLSC